MNTGGREFLVEGDLLATLKKCGGYYQCPEDSDGNLIGPLVGYAGTYKGSDNQDLHYVGSQYFNFSRADQWPAVLRAFAHAAVLKLDRADIEPRVILGAPMAGLKLSQAIADNTESRCIYAEKSVCWVARVGDEIYKPPIENLKLARYEINPGDRVVICEELVNNFSTTGKLIELALAAGGEVIGIVCAINRSYPFANRFLDIPVVSVIEASTPQYRQDDPMVAWLVETGEVIWKPKIGDWPRLQKVMEEHGVF